MNGDIKRLVMGLGKTILFLVVFVLVTFPYGGGLAKIREANPKYQNPNRYFQNLVEIYNSDFDEHPIYWRNYYLEQCDQYGKNWQKIHRCFDAYRTCEKEKPLSKDGGIEHTDIFSEVNSKKYSECLDTYIPKTWQVKFWRWIGSHFRD